ncbi:hypothetical protein Vretimale_8063 [Volvox reticuliferus]|uniref:Pherophorin domain-containing protein n=1 Tax=Volvox reticuliferus TaxID=1737510 RepID=A0A8J4GAG1_9CHLO|nr:hypothetical protein Vretifemale_5220 [Volvox reticuliferus]GIM03304.1 hypothetical protein Vretimale_8063 [Volvox reticuliferus]
MRMGISSPLGCRYGAAWALLHLLVGTANTSMFPNRYAMGTCTLRKELEQNCQVKSVFGMNQTSGSFHGLFMKFGETNCVVSIEQCYPNTCYSFRDLTSQLPSGFLQLASNGFVKSFEIISGGKNANITKDGVSFIATSSKVRVRYSTVSCQEFYRYHGSIPLQTCHQPIEAITTIDTRTPNSLPCS